MLRTMRLTTLAWFAAVVLTPTLAISGEAVSIRLDGVPDVLVFPAPEGANLVLTAAIEGDAVDGVWLGYGEGGAVPMLRSRTNVYAINLASDRVSDLVQRRGIDGELRVVARNDGHVVARSVAIRYRLMPQKPIIDFTFDEARLRIGQRRWKELPSSRGSVRLSLGDITGGQVLVTISGPKSEVLLESRSMREGEMATFSVGDQTLALRIDRLVNILVGQDYAIVTVLSEEGLGEAEVEALLDWIATSSHVFLRNRVEMSGRDFAALLRAKRDHGRRYVNDVESFITRTATRSTTSGLKYRVRLEDGNEIELDAWLREQSAHMATVGEGKDSERPDDRELEPCTMNQDRYDRLLDQIYDSGVQFLCNGKDLMTASDFVRLQPPVQIGGSLPLWDCHDDFVRWWQEVYGCCKDAYQARLPSGETVLMSTWLKQQVQDVIEANDE